MGMVLSNKRMINGVNPKIAKNICEWCSHQLFSTNELAERLEVTEFTMAQWLALLAEAGFLEMHESDGCLVWGVTLAGYHGLSKARFGKPLSGSQFADLVLKVIERIELYNTESHFPFFIDAAYLFGPILSQPWLHYDPAIIISTSIKPGIDQHTNWRVNYYARFGPDRNLTFLDQMSYPDHELTVALRKQGEHIEICIEDSILPSERRLIYQRSGRDVDTAERKAQSLMSSEEIELLGRKIDASRAENPSRSRKKAKHGSFAEIAEYWKDDKRFRRLGISPEKVADSCWRCGSTRDLQHCHIIPAALGGPDEVSNFVILCSRCHSEGPNLSDPEIMFDWIFAYRTLFGKDYWNNVGAAEYERIYNRSVHDEVKEILTTSKSTLPLDDALCELGLLLNEASTQAIFHFGQTWFTNATMAGLYRIALKRLADRL